jgi:hypothetical protein
MTTYYIEDSNGEILGYWSQLKPAKDMVIALGIPFNCLRIVCLKGQYKYEGRHAYYMKYNGKAFYYEK